MTSGLSPGTQPDRSRAGKPELHLFVSIRVHSWFKTPPNSPLRLSVKIRVHPWQKKPPWYCQPRTHTPADSRPRLAQQPPNTEHRTPTLCVSLRGFAASRETNSPQANSLQANSTPSRLSTRDAAGQILSWKARATGSTSAEGLRRSRRLAGFVSVTKCPQRQITAAR